MGIVETYRLAKKGIRPEITLGKCLMEDMGEVQVSTTDYLARDSELVCY